MVAEPVRVPSSASKVTGVNGGGGGGAGGLAVVVAVVVAVAGAAQGSAQTVALGVLTGAAGAAYRARAVHNYWVTCRFRPSTNTIIVEPTHPRFDAAAHELYVRSIG